jgi:hypothetical protein
LPPWSNDQTATTPDPRKSLVKSESIKRRKI